MTEGKISRRTILSMAGAVAGAGIMSQSGEAAAKPAAKPPFTYSLNMATIRGYNLDIVAELEAASKAGYTGVEPWISKVTQYKQKGGSLSDLKKRIADLGLTIEGAIGFASWIVDDDAARTKGLEGMKRDMDTVAQIGGKRIAAPPAGANKGPMLDLDKVAERYGKLLELGDEMGVLPLLELWGFSANLHRLGQTAYVLAECGHPKASLLADIYHIYKGGSNFHGIKTIASSAIEVFHMNDYPNMDRDKIGDKDRVWPGDGVTPMKQILTDLAAKGGTTVLSLELFNPNYWKTDAVTTAKTGLAKMQECVAKAIG